jgi:hypothetical protein
VEVPVSKLVPLFEEGADDLEQKLLASARSDGPPDGAARAKTLAAIAAAAPPVAGAAAVAHPAHIGAILAKWAAIALVGVSIAFGSRLIVDARDDAARAASKALPRGAASGAAVGPELSAEAPSVRPAEAPRSSAVSVFPPRSARSAPASPSVAQTKAEAPAAAVPGDDVPDTVERVGGAGGAAPSAPVSPHVLHEETVALEAAREALAAGAGARALRLLDDHDARFPAGPLAEEGVLLRVQTLVAAHRVEDARRVVDDFGAKSPASSYLPRMRALVERKQ